MISIGSVKEDLAFEKRISITPETVKKFKELNFSVFLEKNYGEHLGISDLEYKNSGATILPTNKEVFEKSKLILKVDCLKSDEVNLANEKSIIIGQFDVFNSK